MLMWETGEGYKQAGNHAQNRQGNLEGQDNREGEKSHMIHNPIIPGFYPDPSIVRVGEDYYLVCSSFELYPGIPIFHSRDLANWEQIGYVMTKENGFHVGANIYSGGVMAPTIRYRDGVFYVINANFGDRGNFIVTAADPRGPWSEPHWITDVPDIDCSLFFDQDGSCYLISPGDDPDADNGRAFFLTPYDIEEFHVAGERKKIWDSALRRAWAPEAPHLYHIGDYYYLLIAEGGTEHNHSVAVARSRTIDGWYEGDPANPVLTHRNLGWEYPIENVGHADLVDTPSGRWYAVELGVRIMGGQHMNLGRETFICPVQWERDWPVFAPGSGKIKDVLPADPDLPWTEVTPEMARDDFDSATLDLCWSFWGTPYMDFWKIEDSCLSLKCLPRPLARKLRPLDFEHVDRSRGDNVSFLGRRLRSRSFRFSFSIRFTAHGTESAGMVVMQAANHQYRLEKRCIKDRQALVLVLATTVQKGLPFLPGYESSTTEETLKQSYVDELLPGTGDDDELIFSLAGKEQDFSFLVGPDENQLVEFYVHADGRRINPEEIGGMVGTLVGMFASGNGEETENRAVFDWAELKEMTC